MFISIVHLHLSDVGYSENQASLTIQKAMAKHRQLFQLTGISKKDARHMW